jgi:hypothetical protein
MRGSVHRRLIALVGLTIVASLATSAVTCAAAAPVPLGASGGGDRNNIANGKRNISSVSIRSPANIKGVQIVSDENAATVESRNSAICRKKRYCRIHQRSIANVFP